MPVAAARTTSVLDCGAAVLFACAVWRWSRVLLPTHMRPYPGANVSLPAGEAWVFVRDPAHLHPFVPDARTACSKPALEAGLVASVLLLAVIAHCARREAPVAVACLCWALGLADLVTNPTKNYVGRLRPNFYTSCGWDARRSECSWEPSRMPDPHFPPIEARHSFPSEHASSGMCAGLLITLYALQLVRQHSARLTSAASFSAAAASSAAAAASSLAASGGREAAASRREGVNTEQRAHGWRRRAGRFVRDFAHRSLTALALTPACFAVWVSASRVHDNWHHPADVGVGMLLGGACAALAFGCYFGSVLTPLGAPADRARAGYQALTALAAAESKAEEHDYGEADCYRQMP